MSLDRPLFRMAILDPQGRYYTAGNINPDGSYHVGISIVNQYTLKYLPNKWNETEITWERNSEWMGSFRSLSDPFEFSDDGYAILRSIYTNGGGMRAKAQLRIDVRIDTESSPGAADMWRYETFYQSYFNFEEFTIDLETERITLSLLDQGAYQYIKSFAGTQYNIPYWTWNGTAWVQNCEFIIHNGIKMLWHADWQSAATPAAPLQYNMGSNPIVGQDTDGILHTFPAMANVNYVQNNGASTFIGNDVLQPFLLQNSQASEANQTLYDNYSQETNLIHCFLKGNPKMAVSLTYEVGGTVVTYNGGAPGRGLKFMIFELGPADGPLTSGIPTVAYEIAGARIDLTNNASGDHTVPAPSGTFGIDEVVLKYDHVYCFALVASPGLTVALIFNNLTVSFFSEYNSGSSTPPDAPIYPPTPVAAYRPFNLFQQIVANLPTIATDAYGFPVPVTTSLVAASDALQANTDELDNVPMNTLFTSGNALRLINGQPYLNMSLRDFHTCCRNFWGMGLSVEGSDYNTIRIEKLTRFFDVTTMILDLGAATISKPTITPLNDYLANNVKAGFGTVDRNSDFGIDSFCGEQDYRTPITNEVKDLNIVSPVTADMYAGEKARVQQNTQPIQSPSSDNSTFVMEVAGTGSSMTVYDPTPLNAGAHTVTPYTLRTYPTAQNYDTTGAAGPYIRGLYYPDTAYNIGLTPARNVLRNSPLLRSQLGLGSADVLTFVKQYQMLYDNSEQPIPGISTNLPTSGQYIDEVADIPVGAMGDPLFNPNIISFTTDYAANVYLIIQVNPYGYVRAVYKNKEYKGFIWKVSQKIGSKAATTWDLLATADMVI